MSDIRAIEALMRANYEAVGFIPRPRLAWYEERGQVLTASENDELCGYLVFGNGWPILKVYQAVVAFDARRREHGLAMVARLVRLAESRNLHGIALWCADDLDANEFWRAAGFTFVRQRRLRSQRGRAHNQWVLMTDNQPTLGLTA